MNDSHDTGNHPPLLVRLLVRFLGENWKRNLVVLYNMGLLVVVGVLACLILRHGFPGWLRVVREPVICGLVGFTGGITYCLWGVYTHACRLNDWKDRWLLWYYIRPFVSLVLGVVSYIFLKAGLLSLGSGPSQGSGESGGSGGSKPSLIVFCALAFFAGMSVEKFLDKLKEVMSAAFGSGKNPDAYPFAEMSGKKFLEKLNKVARKLFESGKKTDASPFAGMDEKMFVEKFDEVARMVFEIEEPEPKTKPEPDSHGE